MTKDIVPKFKLLDLTVRIPVDPAVQFCDPPHESNGFLVYTFPAQCFGRDEGVLPSRESGFAGTSCRSTPWETLSEIFSAWQALDSERFKSAYVTGPGSPSKDINGYPPIAQMQLLFAFQQADRLRAIVRCLHPSEQIIAWHFVQRDGTWLAIADGHDPSLDIAAEKHIASFLRQHEPGDLLTE